jgi:uncharacterized protein YbjT (DUF2867 family)
MAEQRRIVVVTGATGRQGGATARRLLAEGWRVRALVRDATRAQDLAARGAEIAVGDLGDPASLAAAMAGAYGAVSVQPADPREVEWGRAVLGAAEAAGLEHLVYLSTGGAPAQTRYRALGKWELEEATRASSVPATILRPAAFMADFVTERFGLPDQLAVPYAPELGIHLIAIEDIAGFVASALARPDEHVGRAWEIAGDTLTAPEIAAALSAAAGRPIPYTRIPLDVVRRHSPEVLPVLEWAQREYYRVDLAELRRRMPGLLDFRGWLARDADSVARSLAA